MISEAKSMQNPLVTNSIGSILGPVFFNIFNNYLDDRTGHLHQICWWHKTGRRGSCAKWSLFRGAQYTAEVGTWKLFEVQQREMSNPTSGQKYQIGHLPVQTGSQLAGKHFYRKGTQDSVWKSWAWGSNVLLQWRRPTAHFRKSTASGLRRVISPFTSGSPKRHTTAWQWLRLAGTIEDHHLALPPQVRSRRTDCSGPCPE